MLTTIKGINIALCTRVMDNFKYIWFTLLLLAYQQILPAQSTLSAGDLILVTVNADGGALVLKKLWHKKKGN